MAERSDAHRLRLQLVGRTRQRAPLPRRIPVCIGEGTNEILRRAIAYPLVDRVDRYAVRGAIPGDPRSTGVTTTASSLDGRLR